MASVNLCDRIGCQSMVKGKALGHLAIATKSDMEAMRVEWELCPGCVGDVMELMETAPTTQRDGAYREGWTPPETQRELEGKGDAE